MDVVLPAPYVKPSQLASPARRLGGQLIDTLVTFGLVIGTVYLVRLFGIQGRSADLLPLLFAGGYYLLSDALPNGQSIGKRLLKMSVIHFETHAPCSIVQSIIRNLTTPFIGFFDWIFIFFGSRRRLGDMLAITLVINSQST